MRRMLRTAAVLSTCALGCAVAAAHAASPAPHRVSVVATEYAYSGVPAMLRAGRTTFRFRNAGREEHEAIVIRLRAGRTLAEAIDRQLEGGTADPVGFSHAKPGRTGATFTKTLKPGRYAVLCLLRKRGRAHAELGQVARLRVR